MVFKKTLQRHKSAPAPKFRWRPKTPMFIVVSGDEAEEAKISKSPFQGCTRNRATFGPPPGRAVTTKHLKNLKIHHVLKGHTPKIQNFQQQQRLFFFIFFVLVLLIFVVHLWCCCFESAVYFSPLFSVLDLSCFVSIAVVFVEFLLCFSSFALASRFFSGFFFLGFRSFFEVFSLIPVCDFPFATWGGRSSSFHFWFFKTQLLQFLRVSCRDLFWAWVLYFAENTRKMGF